MKFTITTLLILFSFEGFSQTQSNSIERQSQSMNYEYPRITLVAKIAVSETTTVHTYKFETRGQITVNSDDSIGKKKNSDEVNDIIQTFQNIDGVSECTFDDATQSFTILTGPTTDLFKAVNQINQK